jgi:hypothetical protein
MMRRPTLPLFVILLATACRGELVREGPLASVALNQLGHQPRCSTDTFVPFCQARRGDTTITVILDSLSRPVVVSQYWTPRDSTLTYDRLIDSLSHIHGAGLPCELDGDMAARMGRAWITPPLVIRVRFAEDGRPRDVHVSQRWASVPGCSGSAERLSNER